MDGSEPAIIPEERVVPDQPEHGHGRQRQPRCTKLRQPRGSARYDSPGDQLAAPRVIESDGEPVRCVPLEECDREDHRDERDQPLVADLDPVASAWLGSSLISAQ